MAAGAFGLQQPFARPIVLDMDNDDIFPLAIYGEGVPAKRAGVRSKNTVIFPCQNNSSSKNNFRDLALRRGWDAPLPRALPRSPPRGES